MTATVLPFPPERIVRIVPRQPARVIPIRESTEALERLYGGMPCDTEEKK
jgi:hypothetical protein